MKKSLKGLLVLLVPTLAGFFIGFLVGGGFRSRDKAAAETPSLESREQTFKALADSSSSANIEEEGEDEAFSSQTDVDGMGETVTPREVVYYRSRMQYSKLFNDLNDAHLAVAKRIGLKEIPHSRSDISSIGGLVRIENCNKYIVDDLTHSVPFLTAGAASELDCIASAFCDSLSSKGLLTNYRLIVTSVLRTEEDVLRLQRSGNPNASDNSSHCYGTTFDIAYTRYFCTTDETEARMQPFELTKVLGEVLLDEKKAGRCIVKYERKEHCFHITSCI